MGWKVREVNLMSEEAASALAALVAMPGCEPT